MMRKASLAPWGVMYLEQFHEGYLCTMALIRSEIFY